MKQKTKERILRALKGFEDSMAYSAPETIPYHMAQLRLAIESALSTEEEE